MENDYLTLGKFFRLLAATLVFYLLLWAVVFAQEATQYTDVIEDLRALEQEGYVVVVTETPDNVVISIEREEGA